MCLSCDEHVTHTRTRFLQQTDVHSKGHKATQCATPNPTSGHPPPLFPDSDHVKEGLEPGLGGSDPGWGGATQVGGGNLC